MTLLLGFAGLLASDFEERLLEKLVDIELQQMQLVAGIVLGLGLGAFVLALTQQCMLYRIPEPVRQADLRSRGLVRQFERWQRRQQKQQRKKPPKFRLLSHNRYHDARVRKEMLVPLSECPVCSCDPAEGCGEDCMNRIVMMFA